MPLPLEQWYFEIPLITRVYLTLVALTSLACTLDIIKPIQLYFNWNLIIYNKEYWRLITSFLYFGNFSIDFIFHMFFLSRYSRMLEEGSFRGRTADYFWMILLGVLSFIIVIPLFTAKSQFLFLSTPLTFMLVYIWARRNPHVRMTFLGILNFSAPYLPWVLLGFSIVLNNIWPAGDILGLVIGHIYYFLEDVYPKLFNLPANYHILKAPKFVKQTFDYFMRDATDANIADDMDEDLDLEPIESENEVTAAASTSTNLNTNTNTDTGTGTSSDETTKLEGGYRLGGNSSNLDDKKSNEETTTENLSDKNEILSKTETSSSNPNTSTEGLKKRNLMTNINSLAEPGGYNWSSSATSTSVPVTENSTDEKKNE